MTKVLEKVRRVFVTLKHLAEGGIALVDAALLWFDDEEFG